MTAAGLAFGFVVMGAAGAGTAGLLVRDHRLRRTEFAGWSVLLGTLVVPLLLFGFSALATGPALIAWVTLAALGLGVLGGLRLRGREWTPDELPPAGAMLLGMLVLIVAWQALARPIGTDGLFNFEFRARIAFQAGGVLPASLHSGAVPQPWHPAYPPGLSMAELWLYLCMGVPHQGWIKLLGVWWFAGALLLIAGMIPRRTPLAALLLLATPGLLLAPGGPTWLWADFPLAAWLLAGVCALRGGAPFPAPLFAAALCGLVWTKQEGTLLALLLLLAGMQGRPKGALLAAGIPPLLLWSAWHLFLGMRGLAPDTEYLAVSRLPAELHRLPTVAMLCIREWFTWERWGLLWLLLLPAAARVRTDGRLRHLHPVILIVPGAMLGYGLIYLLSGWPDYRIHLTSSYPRLLLPPALLAVVTVAAAARWRRDKPDPLSRPCDGPGSSEAARISPGSESPADRAPV